MRYKYTGLYWEHVGFPLRGARVDDLEVIPGLNRNQLITKKLKPSGTGRSTCMKILIMLYARLIRYMAYLNWAAGCADLMIFLSKWH